MKKKAVWKSILADVCIALLCLISFAYVKYVRPYSEKAVPVVNAQETVFTQESQAEVINPTGSSMVTFQTTNPDAEITQIKHYISDNQQMMTDTYQVKQVRNDKEETFFVTDVYVTDVTMIQTAFAQDTFGQNIRELPMDMMNHHNGLIGISGDNYGESGSGVCVRNGQWYRTEQGYNDICALFQDGTMEMYAPEEYDEAVVREKNPWQVWSFGPSLLDENGEVPADFNSSPYILAVNPRCAIGYMEPGHYLMIVLDGREDGYSQGLDMTEFAQLCKELGCTKAYNLDGGKTATMMTSEELINKPCEDMYTVGGRNMSDIIYVTK